MPPEAVACLQHVAQSLRVGQSPVAKVAYEIKAKTKAQPAPKQIVEAVANGDAELAVFLLNVLIDPHLEIVGPFPAEVQREVVYAVGVAANSKDPETAKAFVAYLMSPSSIAVIKAKGMDPG